MIDPMLRLRVEVVLARWHGVRGDLDGARAALPDLDGGETTQRDIGAAAWVEVARIRLAHGDAETAWEAAAHAANLAASLPRQRAAALCAEAEALLALGHRDRARDARDAAHLLVERLALSPTSPLARELAALSRALG